MLEQQQDFDYQLVSIYPQPFTFNIPFRWNGGVMLIKWTTNISLRWSTEQNWIIAHLSRL